MSNDKVVLSQEGSGVNVKNITERRLCDVTLIICNEESKSVCHLHSFLDEHCVYWRCTKRYLS